MRYFFSFVPGLLAILFGSMVLLYLLPCAFFSGPYDWLPLLYRVFGLRAVMSVLGAVAVVVLGITHLLHSTFLQGLDGHERSEAIPIFWTSLAVCTVSFFSLLVAIAYAGFHSRDFLLLHIR
jgi:hypothetical protein